MAERPGSAGTSFAPLLPASGLRFTASVENTPLYLRKAALSVFLASAYRSLRLNWSRYLGLTKT